MSISGLQKTGTKYAKRYFRLTILSVVIAAVTTAVVGSVGTPGRLSVVPGRLSVVPGRLSIPAVVGVFLQTFGLCFATGLVLRVLARNVGKLRAVWSEWIGGPLCRQWNRLARRTQAVLTGIVTALVAGGITAAVRMMSTPTGGTVSLFVVSVPLVVGVMLLGWPLGTYWMLRRRPSGGQSDTTERTVVASRYAKLRHLETRTIAVLVGFLFATAIGSGLWILGVKTASMVGVALLVWVVATVVVYNQYAATLPTRTELAIVATAQSDEESEILIKHTGTDPIELRNVTIEDTTGGRYWLGDTLSFQPGSRATIQLPAEFVVDPTDAERTLPLGYTLDRSRAAPVVYSETGVAFELTHQSTDKADQWAETQDSQSPQSTVVSPGRPSQK